MRWNARKYISLMWERMKPGTAEHSAVKDQSEKLQALATDIERYIAAQLDDRLAFLENEGTRILTTSDSCPLGWEEDTDMRDRFVRGPDASGANVGQLAGADSHDHTMNHTHGGSTDSQGDHVHTISADGTHDHNVTLTVQDVQSGSGANAAWAVSESNAGSHSHGDLTGVNGAHIHTLAIDAHNGSTGTGSNVPQYKRMLVCKRKS